MRRCSAVRGVLLMAAAVLLTSGLASCGPVAPVEWAAIGAVAGASGAAFTLDDDLLRYFLGETTPQVPAAP